MDKDKSQDGNQIIVGSAVHILKDRESQDRSALFEFTVRPNQIPAIVEQLRQKGKDSSWVVFLFYTPNMSTETDDDCLALQYSIQRNIVGLDWVLLAPRNIADQVKIAEFSTSRSHKVTKVELNGVYYLRVEDGDIYKLGLNIVEEFYRMPHDADIGVLVSGFSLSIGGRTLH